MKGHSVCSAEVTCPPKTCLSRCLCGSSVGDGEVGSGLPFVAGGCSVAGGPTWFELGPASPGPQGSGWQLGPHGSPPSLALCPAFNEAEIKSHTIHRETLTKWSEGDFGVVCRMIPK